MELTRHVPRVIRQLDDFDQRLIDALVRNHQARSFQLINELVVDFEAVAMTLDDFVGTVGFAGAADAFDDAGEDDVDEMPSRRRRRAVASDSEESGAESAGGGKRRRSD
mgnify:CR=1 FL=1